MASVVHEKSPNRKLARLSSVTPERLRSALAAFDAGAGEILYDIGHTRIIRVPFDAKGEAVVKVRTSRTLKAKVEDAVRGTRAWRAFKVGLELEERSIAVAPPLACIEEGGRGVLIVRSVPGKTLWAALADASKKRDRAAVEALVVRAARTAARLHAAGATHGDFKPQNALVPPAPPGSDLVLLDLERVRFDAAKSTNRVARDLAALDAYGQRLDRPLSARARKRAFDAYVEARKGIGAPVADEKTLLARVLRESRAKRKRWRAAGKA